MEISISREKEFVSVKLGGVINEDNDLADHLEKIAGPLVVIDLSEVERINSCGVRDWVNWIGALEAKGSKMLFLKCSPSIVAQINLVNNFTGNGQIKSCYLPYYCEGCNEEHTILYEAEDLATEQLPPTSRCNGCEQFMDFDDMADSYFAFLTDQDLLLKTDPLSQAQNLDLSKHGSSPTAPVLALGSTHLPDIDQLLETSPGADKTAAAPTTDVAPLPAPEVATASSAPQRDESTAHTRAIIGGGVLLVVAAAAAFALLA